MFRRLLHTALCATLIAGAALPVAAEAGPRYGYRDYYERYDADRDWERRHHRREARREAEREERRARERAERRREERRRARRDDDDAEKFIAGAIAGLATAAIISSATRDNRPVYRTVPAPTYRETGGLEPWTPEWRRWCSERYRSFNPSTGFWRGYDGRTYFCRP
ncbi:BA14K family protein [Notoacmeibacter ruber]|uniref:Lectin-like protein BA14k n=1 Tax=Notoacmeibacter ruber TaxID=2670375 RepID=A0A3L7JCX1_9HYPH|nr:BA14K family protein [Notoacmeibacter ruber]RLQ88320.1 BA14K family protein [Notoacmeibacter ruber]